MRTREQDAERKRLARQTPEGREAHNAYMRAYNSRPEVKSARKLVRQNCTNCGKPKEPGRGRRLCVSCVGVDVSGLSIPEMLRAHALRQYGLTPDQYDALFTQQGGVCAICKAEPKTKKLAVDHDHDTGEVRGLLCPRCNSTLEFWMEHERQIREYLYD